MQARSYSVKTIYLIAIAAIVKLFVSPLLELGNDEVYYWTYALHTDWNHFDHPPRVGLLIRLTSLNLWWASEISLRLGSILAAACSTWFIFKLGKLISSERTGWFAASIYTASVYTGFIAGFFILPDSPQMPFWTGSLYIMAYLVLNKREEKNTGIWLLLGLTIGLASLCKIHGLFLWVGFGLFIICYSRRWLANWRIYVSALVTLICLMPILYWNLKFDFITYKFHSERVTHTGVQWDSFVREISGEFAYQNPVITLLLLTAVGMFLFKKIRFGNKNAGRWLLLMSIPMLLVFWGVSLFNPTLPHWSGPAYIPLFLIAALYLDKNTKNAFSPWIVAAFTLVVVVLFSAVLLVRFSPVNFGSQEKENYGEYCPTLDLSGWKELGVEFSAIVKKDIADSTMQQGSLLLADKWFPAGHLEFYVSRPSAIPLIGVGTLQNLHQFAWLNQDRPVLKKGADAYCIVPSNLPFNVQQTFGTYFTTVLLPVELKQIRSGKVVRYFYVYRLKDCKKIPAPFF